MTGNVHCIGVGSTECKGVGYRECWDGLQGMWGRGDWNLCEG